MSRKAYMHKMVRNSIIAKYVINSDIQTTSNGSSELNWSQNKNVYLLSNFIDYRLKRIQLKNNLTVGFFFIHIS